MPVWSDGCGCVFPDACSGSGTVYCGNHCCSAYSTARHDCECGGYRDCPGCAACGDHRDDEPGWGDGESL